MANLAELDKTVAVTHEEFSAIQTVWDAEKQGAVTREEAEFKITEILRARHPNAAYQAWWILAVARDIVFDPGKPIANSATAGMNIPTQGKMGW